MKFVWHRDSNAAACLIISLGQYLNDKDRHNIGEYLTELAKLKERPA